MAKILESNIKYLSEGCADNPKSCLEKCKKDDGNACYSLALLIQKNRDIQDENSEALFLRSCKLGIVSGCTNRAAGIYELASKNSEKTKCAVDTFEKTCSLEDAWGCTMFGSVLASGDGRKKNTTEALTYFSKACAKNEKAEACQRARQFEKLIELNLEGENK